MRFSVTYRNAKSTSGRRCLTPLGRARRSAGRECFESFFDRGTDCLAASVRGGGAARRRMTLGEDRCRSGPHRRAELDVAARNPLLAPNSNSSWLARRLEPEPQVSPAVLPEDWRGYQKHPPESSSATSPHLADPRASVSMTSSTRIDAMARRLETYNRDCGCGRCPTWASFELYSCHCLLVAVHNDRRDAPSARISAVAGAAAASRATQATIAAHPVMAKGRRPSFHRLRASLITRGATQAAFR